MPDWHRHGGGQTSDAAGLMCGSWCRKDQKGEEINPKFGGEREIYIYTYRHIYIYYVYIYIMCLYGFVFRLYIYDV